MLGDRADATAVRDGCAAGVFGFVLHFGQTVFTVLAGLHLAEHYFFSIFSVDACLSESAAPESLRAAGN